LIKNINGGTLWSCMGPAGIHTTPPDFFFDLELS
jgi:hypothetical protein